MDIARQSALPGKSLERSVMGAFAVRTPSAPLNKFSRCTVDGLGFVFFSDFREPLRSVRAVLLPEWASLKVLQCSESSGLMNILSRKSVGSKFTGERKRRIIFRDILRHGLGTAMLAAAATSTEDENDEGGKEHEGDDDEGGTAIDARQRRIGSGAALDRIVQGESEPAEEGVRTEGSVRLHQAGIKPKTSPSSLRGRSHAIGGRCRVTGLLYPREK
ncbi:hypothetical protein B0H10DRAFT_1944405 [Mycena sp. CBHHK59/15]|nr:hypothetical protein B0H10DRAFT_1944405 [Mycena sp. CBHHK59/15]